MGELIKGKVIVGYGEGRKIGFPTANLELLPGSFRPTAGVYAAWVKKTEAKNIPAIVITGVYWERAGVPRVEVYLLGFNGDLYGQELVVEVVEKIRDIIKPKSRGDLLNVIKRDIETTGRILGL